MVRQIGLFFNISVFITNQIKRIGLFNLKLKMRLNSSCYLIVTFMVSNLTPVSMLILGDFISKDYRLRAFDYIYILKF